MYKRHYITSVIYKRSRQQAHNHAHEQARAIEVRDKVLRKAWKREIIIFFLIKPCLCGWRGWVSCRNSWQCSHLQTLMHNLTFNIHHLFQVLELLSVCMCARVCVCNGFAAPFDSNNFHAYLKRCNKFLIEDSPAVHLVCASHKATTTNATRIC